MNRKRYILFAVLLVILPFALPVVATGQSVQGKCGDLSHAQDDLVDLFPLFTDDHNAAVRGTVLQQLSPSSVHEVVTDKHVCQKVMHAVKMEAMKAGNWKEVKNGPVYDLPVRSVLRGSPDATHAARHPVDGIRATRNLSHRRPGA